MSKQLFTPGDPVAVGDLEVGDTIYARQNHLTKQPSTPVEVVKLTPSVKTTGLIRVVVQSPYQRRSPWSVGYVSVSREYLRAEPVAE